MKKIILTEEEYPSKYSKEELISLVNILEKKNGAMNLKLKSLTTKLTSARSTIKFLKLELGHCRKKILAFRYPHGARL
jgi:hypothetical protein